MTSGNQMIVAGVMSGSSLDGVDIVVAEFSTDLAALDYQILGFKTLEYSDYWKQILPEMIGMDTYTFLRTEASYSKMLAEMIHEYLYENGLQPALIGSHGHTVLHLPEDGVSCQIGSGAAIAALTGIDTVCDFRRQDVVLGGQGAPLAPLVEKILFPGYLYYLNLGGIANISVHHGKDITGWDICPCNQVLNYISQKLGYVYDDEGHLARQGQLDPVLLQDLKAMEYFRSKPPKTLDNNWIKNEYLPVFHGDDYRDMLFTQCAFAGEQIASDINLYGVDSEDGQMLVTGGGAFNTFLMECIQAETEIELVTPDRVIIESKESLLMALMGYLYIQREDNILASVTGGRSDFIAGAFYKGCV